MRTTSLLALLAAMALIVAACGNDDDSDAPGEAAGNGDTADAETTAGDDSEPTPDAASRFRNTWTETDFSQTTVDLDEIRSGGVPVDGIPPLDADGATSLEARQSGEANFAPVDDMELDDNIPVAFIEHEGEARAYPLHILTLHEVVNDVVADTPVAMTFCPLCNTVLAFDREVDGEVLDFGVSGLLRHSDLVMWDRQTESWWQQATGQGIVGEHAGTQLTILRAGIMSFADFRDAHPGSLVLTEETGLGRTYGSNPYVGYDELGSTPFLFDGEVDDRLPAMERVVSIRGDDGGVAVPFTFLHDEHVAHVTVDGEDYVVLWGPGTASALDRADIGESRDVGSAIAYIPEVDGEQLEFEPGDEPGKFVDTSTGSTWDTTGTVIDGQLEGERLEMAEHMNIFWFAWAAFAPDTAIWEG